MGQANSSYLRSGDSLPTENNAVRDSQVVGCDMTSNRTCTDGSSRRQDADSFSANVRGDNNTTSSFASSAFTPAGATVESRQRKAKHLPWFLANMTEEHWERLNMMCIEIPSSS